MSNTCFTSYVITGRHKDLESLHNTLQKMQSDKSPIVENEWPEPNMWLGCLVKALGGEPSKVPCRGYITSFAMNPDGTLSIDIETAWNEYPDLRYFIECCFDYMKIYYYEDACEDDILNSNDIDHRFFKDRIFIDHDGSLDDYNDGRFESYEEAAEAVSDIVGYEVEPESDAIQEALIDYMDSNPGSFFSYHEVNYIDD